MKDGWTDRVHVYAHTSSLFPLCRFCDPEQFSLLTFVYPSHVQKSSVLMEQSSGYCQCNHSTNTAGCCGDRV